VFEQAQYARVERYRLPMREVRVIHYLYFPWTPLILYLTEEGVGARVIRGIPFRRIPCALPLTADERTTLKHHPWGNVGIVRPIPRHDADRFLLPIPSVDRHNKTAPTARAGHDRRVVLLERFSRLSSRWMVGGRLYLLRAKTSLLELLYGKIRPGVISKNTNNSML
jgi:hypothetical protein